MPLKDNRGTEQDGSPSEKFCSLCYKNGSFIDPNITVEQMQETAVKALRQKHWPNFLAKMAAGRIPKLERWKT